MTDQPGGANGAVFLVSAARTPIGRFGGAFIDTPLARREGHYGLATLCLGGGGSVAMAFERVA